MGDLLGHRHASDQPDLLLFQHRDDLFFREPGSLHVRLLVCVLTRKTDPN